MTSNHIHLLVQDTGEEVISNSIKLIASTSAQNFNNRKIRKRAYWEDRYHATAIQSIYHFLRCMSYIDLNMVRAGIVGHPKEWKFGGFHEVRKPKERYRLIDHEAIVKLSGASNMKLVIENIDSEITKNLKFAKADYDCNWSESIAIGDKNFVENFKKNLGPQGAKRNIDSQSESYSLNEDKSHYGIENHHQNSFFF